jgi:hypothetical protein
MLQPLTLEKPGNTENDTPSVGAASEMDPGTEIIATDTLEKITSGLEGLDAAITAFEEEEEFEWVLDGESVEEGNPLYEDLDENTETHSIPLEGSSTQESPRYQSLAEAFARVRDLVENAETALSEENQPEAEREDSPKRILHMMTSLQRYGQTVLEKLRHTLSSADEATADEANREEAEILELETQMGIHTDRERIREAALLIEPDYLKVALLRGDEHPERLFGTNEWRKWLQARVAAREMDKTDMQGLRNLHRILTSDAGDLLDRGRIRTYPYFYEGARTVVISPKEAGAIEKNPYIRFEYTDKEKGEGVIVYTHQEEQELFEKGLAILPEDARLKVIQKPESFVSALTQEALTRYAQKERDLPAEGITSPEDSYGYIEEAVAAAADLQHDLISIHPTFDYNGRLSRLLMQQCLERTAGNTSVVAHPEKDLLSTQEMWRQRVDERLGHPGPTLDRKTLTFYREVLEPIGYVAPPKEEVLEHIKCTEFLEGLEQTAEEFNRVTTLEIAGMAGVETGGLIPRDFMGTWADTRPEAQEKQNQFYTETTVYRGGTFTGNASKEAVLRMFTTPVAVNTAYRPLHEEHKRTQSLNPINTDAIRKCMETYNRLLLHDYFIQAGRYTAQGMQDPERDPLPRFLESAALEAQEHTLWGDIEPNKALSAEEEEKKHHADFHAQSAYGDGYYLHRLLSGHEDMREDKIHLSPVVSTSGNHSVARRWAKKNPDKGEHGIVIKTLLPNVGVYHTPSIGEIPLMNPDAYTSPTGTYEKDHYREDEFLIVGGISPNAITEVNIDDVLIATRTPNNEVHIRNVRTKEWGLYAFGAEGNLELVREGITEWLGEEEEGEELTEGTLDYLDETDLKKIQSGVLEFEEAPEYNITVKEDSV